MERYEEIGLRWKTGMVADALELGLVCFEGFSEGGSAAMKALVWDGVETILTDAGRERGARCGLVANQYGLFLRFFGFEVCFSF